MEKSKSMTIEIRIPRSNAKDLGKIATKKQHRNSNAAPRRTVVAVDTEADDGDIFLLADSSGNKLEYPDITFENVARFLMKYEEKWVFFFNLGYDADCILKLLPEEILKQYRFRKELRFEYKGYFIHYIYRKKLTISKGKHSVSCYDIAQYYDNKSLESAYTEYIKKPLDSVYLATKEQRRDFTLRYFMRHKKQIRKYCIQDCILTKELTDNWLDTFYRVFEFYPRNWISSGYLAEKVLIYNGIEIPFFHDIPYEVQELAWGAFYGGRFELIQRGFIGECYLYDINSAYPYALTTMPDLTQGRWISSNRINPKAALGFFHIRADIDNSVKVAPFPFRTKGNRIIYPVGEFEPDVTLEELKAVDGDPRIRYKILESYQFIPNKNCRYPFKKFIEDLYYKRLKLKEEDNPLERAIKIVLNSIYGKMAQRVNNRIGNIFSPVIASYITGFTRAQLYRFMRDNNLERDVVAFATDSIATRRKIPNLNSKKLGEMKLDKEATDVIFLSNGFYLFNGKWKRRGIGFDREKKVEIEHQGTQVDKDGQLYIKVKTTRTTHIKSGILYNRLQSVGKIEEYEKKINLNSDKKRFWLDDLKSLNDKIVCDSAPINASLVADIIAKKDDLEWYEDDERYEPVSEL